MMATISMSSGSASKAEVNRTIRQYDSLRPDMIGPGQATLFRDLNRCNQLAMY